MLSSCILIGMPNISYAIEVKFSRASFYSIQSSRSSRSNFASDSSLLRCRSGLSPSLILSWGIGIIKRSSDVGEEDVVKTLPLSV